jgi:chemotaxis protein methyltransferase CheR
MRASTVESAMPSIDAGREFDFSDRDFEQIRALIYKRAGISLSEAKRDMVYSRLARRLRALGLQRFSEYLRVLQDSDDGEEWEAFTNSLTTNLTSFFREPHHFPILAEHMLRGRGRPMRIWCCASSTGEEPYSLAITAIEATGSFDPPISIVASDIDTNVLQQAEGGMYSMERLEKMSSERLRRFFLKGSGSRTGYAMVRPEVRRLVSFERVNLLEARWPVNGPLDAIFCRNVMIYFDKQTQAGILRRFAPLMRSDALLFVGHSESLLHVADTFELLGRTVYRLARRQVALDARDLPK